MQTTRRGFLRALGVTAAGVALASNVDGETLRRFWPGWRAPVLAEPNRELAKAVLSSADHSYRTFETGDGVIVRELLSNQSILIPEGGTERYITLRGNAFLMPGDLVRLGHDGRAEALAFEGAALDYVQSLDTILGMVVQRGWAPTPNWTPADPDDHDRGEAIVTVQVGGLAKVGYGETGSSSGKLYRLGVQPDDPDRRRVRVTRPSRNG